MGSTTEFLDLTPVEESLVEMKLALATKLHQMRKKQKLTQQELADRIGSSQSRVAKMEVADTSVSMELFVKSLVSLGASRRQIGEAISAPPALERRKSHRAER